MKRDPNLDSIENIDEFLLRSSDNGTVDSKSTKPYTEEIKTNDYSSPIFNGKQWIDGKPITKPTEYERSIKDIKFADIGVEMARRARSTQIIGHDPLRDFVPKEGIISDEEKAGMSWTSRNAIENQRKTDNSIGSAPTMNTPWGFNDHDDPPTNPRLPNLGRVHGQLLSTMQILVVRVGYIKLKKSVTDAMGLNFTSNASSMNTYIKNNNMFKRALSTGWNSASNLLAMLGDTLKMITTGEKMNKYFQFKLDHQLYAEYLDDMLNEVGAYMGLVYPNKSKQAYVGKAKVLNYINIMPHSHSYRALLTGELAYMPWTINNSCSVSEDISNSTMESPLAASLNSFAQAQQANVSGSNTLTAGLDAAKTGDWKKMGESFVQEIALKGATTFAEKFGADAGVTSSGDGRMALPEIFASSSFSRSFNLNFTFKSPYGVPLCTFENATLPYLMWFTMASPRQLGSTSYTEPFSVQLFSRGMISCTAGMITSLGVTRGEDKNDWTVFGSPRTYEITVSVKDLLPTMSMSTSANSNFAEHKRNTHMRDYMEIIGGIDLETKVSIAKDVGLFITQLKSSMARKYNKESILYRLGRGTQRVIGVNAFRNTVTADRGVGKQFTATYTTTTKI